MCRIVHMVHTIQSEINTFCALYVWIREAVFGEVWVTVWVEGKQSEAEHDKWLHTSLPSVISIASQPSSWWWSWWSRWSPTLWSSSWISLLSYPSSLFSPASEAGWTNIFPPPSSNSTLIIPHQQPVTPLHHHHLVNSLHIIIFVFRDKNGTISLELRLLMWSIGEDPVAVSHLSVHLVGGGLDTEQQPPPLLSSPPCSCPTSLTPVNSIPDHFLQPVSHSLNLSESQKSKTILSKVHLVRPLTGQTDSCSIVSTLGQTLESTKYTWVSIT